jgi:hypothetical protein
MWLCLFELNLTGFQVSFAVMFPMKKVVEGCDNKTLCDYRCEQTICDVSDFYGCGEECGCVAVTRLDGKCIHYGLFKKAVREHYNLCESNNDCIEKGSGSICAYYPNPNSQHQHGWCFTSNIEAQHYFQDLSNPAVKNFKMALDIAT